LLLALRALDLHVFSRVYKS